ncbi:hypothetical protein FGO68_gene7126 [Halteria grandinella]|uniref:Uncharacterized protein n=1 Tax=Halteria grandinella TaxID=5974 RepID=A0A8J8N9S4_HALGN|nr:hypothetical protein FGO68_gene7126 [Halteria grandinella]
MMQQSLRCSSTKIWQSCSRSSPKPTAPKTSCATQTTNSQLQRNPRSTSLQCSPTQKKTLARTKPQSLSTGPSAAVTACSSASSHSAAR